MFESVLLLAPFSPSRAWTSPSAASKSTPSFATTAGNRFVIPRSCTAAPVGTAVPVASLIGAVVCWRALSLRAALDSLDEPVDRVQVLHRQALALLPAQLAALVVERATDLVERAVLQRDLLRLDRGLRLRRDTLAEGRELGEAVPEAAVVEAGLPGALHGGLDALQVVRAP